MHLCWRRCAARSPGGLRGQHEHVREGVEIHERRHLDHLDERIARIVDLRGDADRQVLRQTRFDAERLILPAARRDATLTGRKDKTRVL